MTKNGLLMRLKREVRKLPPNLIEEYGPDLEVSEDEIHIGVLPPELHPWFALISIRQIALASHVNMPWTKMAEPIDIPSMKEEVAVLNLHFFDLCKQIFPEINHRGIDTLCVSKGWNLGVVWRRNAPTSYTHQ